MSCELEKIIEDIAKKYLLVETLETRNRDRLDFHDVHVRNIKKALEMAYEAGKREMTQKLSQCHLIDIANSLGKKLYAFTPVVNKFGIGLGVAIANEKGYMPINQYFFNSQTWLEAKTEADRLNRDELKIDLDIAEKIIISTHFKEEK